MSFAKGDNVGFRRKVTGLGESAGVVESWRPAAGAGTAEEVLIEDDEEEEYLEEEEDLEEEEEGGEDDEEDAETPIPLTGRLGVGRNSGPVPIPRAAATTKLDLKQKGREEPGGETTAAGAGAGSPPERHPGRPFTRGSRRGTEPRSFNRGESYATAYESFDSAEEERRRQEQQAVAANGSSSSSKAVATGEKKKKKKKKQQQQQQEEGESSREGPLKLDPTLSRSNTEFTGELSRAEPIPIMMGDGGSDSEAGSVPPSVEASNSLASLLKHDELARRKKLKLCVSSRGRPLLVSRPSILSPSILSLTRKSSPKKKVRTASEPPPVARLTHASTNKDRVSGGLVRFNTAVDLRERDKLMQLKLADMSRSRSFRHAGRHYSHVRKREGEIIKMENMLVRVEITLKKLPNEYDENESMQVETRTAEKWREYVVVCRETGEEETPFSLRLYKSRVIPAIDRPHVSSHGTREIPLDPKLTKVNLYSSLDKTLVLWLPYKLGTIIYIMRPRCYSSSVEWYTFLRNALGWARPDLLWIQVPDLSLSLRIEDPFGKIEEKLRDSPLDDEAPIREEKVVARNLLNQSMEMLEGIKEWADIIEHWKTNERMGLAWRRYDRIEWIHGVYPPPNTPSLAKKKKKKKR